MSRFVIEEYTDIPIQKKLKEFNFETEKNTEELGKIIIYNPDKWKYVTFTFLENKPTAQDNKKIYSILHLSLDK